MGWGSFPNWLLKPGHPRYPLLPPSSVPWLMALGETLCRSSQQWSKCVTSSLTGRGNLVTLIFPPGTLVSCTNTEGIEPIDTNPSTTVLLGSLTKTSRFTECFLPSEML